MQWKYILIQTSFSYNTFLCINVYIVPPVSAPPRGLEVANFTDTAITVHWEPLECIDINSQFEITGYTVRYGFASEPSTSTEISSSLPIITIKILAPGFEHFIEVAAVNSNGDTGEYSDRIIQTTSGQLLELSAF